MNYKIQYCEVHQISIHYFDNGSTINESHCWDCIREANLKKNKRHKDKEKDD